MDMERGVYLRAQECAEKLLLLKKNGYLDFLDEDSLRFSEGAFLPSINYWYRLKGYRRGNNEEDTIAAHKKAIGDWIRSGISSSGTASFALTYSEDELSVLYGSGTYSSQECLRAGIPECLLEETQWSGSDYKYGGFLCGNINAQKLADLYASAKVPNSYIACMISPVYPNELESKISDNVELKAYLERYKTYQRSYGNSSRRTEEIPIVKVIKAIDVIEKENEYLYENMGSGFVRTIVRFGAKTKDDCRRTMMIMQSSINSITDSDIIYEPVRAFMFNNKMVYSTEEALAIPFIKVHSCGINQKMYPFSMQSIKATASFCMPPLNSYNGFYVKNYNIDANSKDAFPLSNEIKGNVFDIGYIYGTSKRAVIPLKSLLSHTVVSGATDSGKTNTVKEILLNLHDKGIPFVVIEAAKKEYIELLAEIPELRIYTPGNDGFKLCFNPLEPEEGELIENHVAAIVRAITSATGAEHPIPESLDGLFRQTYMQFGWQYGTMAYRDSEKPFPTFKDVFKNVDSYISAHAQYGPEVKRNLTAALKIRTEHMFSGALGGIFNTDHGVRAKDLLESPCVIELTDISPESAAILMNILLFKFHSFLSRVNSSSELKRVIVVEEAHNIFKRTQDETSARALNNDFFDKMLSEIRSSGTGLILSDQRPGILSDAVMANTSVKIIHSLVESNDRKTVGEPSRLSDFQLDKIGEFGKGECVISLMGHSGLQHVQVDKVELKNNKVNCACHVCKARFKCRKKAVDDMLKTLNQTNLALYISKIAANPYNTAQLKRNISNMLNGFNITAPDATKICLLGELLDKYSSMSTQEKRIVTTAYSNYLNRKEN